MKKEKANGANVLLKKPCIPKTLNLAKPNLSNCHACGGRAKSKLQILLSQCRIILLCPKCLFSFEFSNICAYCFSKVSISLVQGIDCGTCNSRFHHSCLSFVLPPKSFTCVDCWVPKSLMLASKVAERLVAPDQNSSTVLGGTRTKHECVKNIGAEVELREGEGSCSVSYEEDEKCVESTGSLFLGVDDTFSSNGLKGRCDS